MNDGILKVDRRGQLSYTPEPHTPQALGERKPLLMEAFEVVSCYFGIRLFWSICPRCRRLGRIARMSRARIVSSGAG